ncbi:MAG: aminotransferase class I/II-fold pyridoxal phosphate-dependent enzyme [Clostridiales bacterium]|nr:aminotransferase class I/II-fold pyridoxal phosphate-dependent enzyme [Clostridiales bacterium]
MNYLKLSKTELLNLKADLEEKYSSYKEKGLKLNMSRGKPSPKQLDLSNALLTEDMGSYYAADGTDARNYGVLEGLPETRQFFADTLGLKTENIIVGGNASLNLEYDALIRCWVFGSRGEKPWGQLPKVKFICLTPGYDRHFGMLQDLGIEMISLELKSDGPDMDKIEEIVKDDSSVKGIFCVPLYSNPTGVCYSEENVRRLAAMPTAAEDFKIFWDNAYGIHHLYDEGEKLADIFKLCEEYGTEDRVYYFFSTSKITHPGSGISCIAASSDMIKEIKAHMTYQTIGHDKINQLRILHFFEKNGGIFEQMKRQASILRPKFEMVVKAFEKGFTDSGILTWENPKGGYFVSVNTLEGCAKSTVALCKEAGLTLTGAGATYPYGKDPKDANIRIAPSYPETDELETAVEVFCVCVKLAAVNKLLENN